MALVTGGSRGIGAAITRRLAREGAAVAFTYVTAPDKAQAVAKLVDADGGRVLVMRVFRIHGRSGRGANLPGGESSRSARAARYMAIACVGSRICRADSCSIFPRR